MQFPAGDRTVFPHHHDCHKSATCTPSCVDSRRKYNKYQARGCGLRQWPQANLTYIDRPRGCAQRVVVWLPSSTDAQSCSTTFSSTTPSLAMSQFEQMLEAMPVDLGLAVTSAYYLEVPVNGELFSSFSQAFHALLRTHHSATLSPVRSTSNYHIMSLVDIGLSNHTA